MLKKINKIIGSLLFCQIASLCFCPLLADEGMWPMPKVKELIADSLYNLGFNLPIDSLYSINNPSIKDAVIIFGKGCTGEMVSENGLLFTNHHCGFSAIQSLSSTKKDIIKEGYWAKNKIEEIPCKDLSVSFLIQYEDITNSILNHLSDTLSYQLRVKQINKLSDSIVKAASENGKYKAEVKEFAFGNQYYLIVYEVFDDIRLVGAPPVSIGKFGGDTDNWTWPRHSSDFSIFRVYTDSLGKPAKFNTSNIPLKPRKFLPISIKGYNEGDLSLVIGFPGTTNRNITASQVSELIEATNKPRIQMREIRLNILKKYMQSDEQLRIKYAAKYATSSNYYKYSIGQNLAIKNKSLIAKKRETEKKYIHWAQNDSLRNIKYGACLKAIDSLVNIQSKYYRAVQYYSETFYKNIEIYGFVRQFVSLYEELRRAKPDSTKIEKSISDILSGMDEFYKDIDFEMDKEIALQSIDSFSNSLEPAYKFNLLNNWDTRSAKNKKQWIEKCYSKTIFIDSGKIKEFLKAPGCQKLEKDPMFNLIYEIISAYRNLYAEYSNLKNQIQQEQRKYIQGLAEMNSNRALYPDANGTMRLSYGTIKGYKPRDAVDFSYYTTLKGLMEKEDSSKTEFVVPMKLKTIYREKAYTAYYHDDNIPLDFISTNDNTGGNSGSPVLNANGELIGITFDGNWEAMGRDILYEPELQRAISVDIRYVLFIIDKFGDAEYLLNELNIKN